MTKQLLIRPLGVKNDQIRVVRNLHYQNGGVKASGASSTALKRRKNGGSSNRAASGARAANPLGHNLRQISLFGHKLKERLSLSFSYAATPPTTDQTSAF